MRRAGRWIKRLIVGLVTMIVVVIVGVLFVLHTHWGRELVRARAEAVLRDNFPGGATIERIDGSILGTLTVSNLELMGRDGKRMVFVSTANFHVELLPLLGNRVRVDTVELGDVIVDQHPQPPAKPEPPAVASGPSPWTIELPSIEVHHARVAITTPRGVVEVHELEAEATMSIVRGAITAALTAHGRAGEHDVAATASVRYGDGELAVPFAEAELDRGGITVIGATLRGGDRVELAGVVAAHVPAAVARLFDVELPANSALVAIAHPDGTLDATVLVGAASLRVMAKAELEARRANVFAIADVPDAATIDPRIAGAGVVTAAVEIERDHVRGLVTADGVHPVDKELLGQDAVRATTLVAVDATLAKAWVLIDAEANVAGARSQVVAELARAPNGEVSVTTSSVVATARRISLEDSDAAIGWLAVNVHATGRILPTPHLHVNGAIDAEQLRVANLGAAALHIRIDDMVRVPSIASNGHLDLTGIVHDGVPFGSASFDVQAAVGTDGTIGIDLGPHKVTTVANGVWSGTGGHVAIDPGTITLRDVHTSSGSGQVTANASFGRQTKNLTAKLDAHDVALGTLVAATRGTLGGTVTVARRGGRWSGDGHFHGSQLALVDTANPARPPIDLDVDLHAAGREVTARVATTSELGGATVAVAVEGPSDLADAAAWRRLDRKALHDLSLELAHVDLSHVGGSGVLDGKLELTATDASGKIALRGVMTSRGEVTGELALAGKGAAIEANVTARLVGVDAVDSVAELALPVRLFDPAAWRALGKGALRGATIHLEPVAFDPTLIAKLGVLLPYRGRVEATAVIAAGAASATGALDVHGFQGGAVREPIELHVDAGIGDDGAHVTATTRTGAVTLVTLSAHTPLTIDGLRNVKLATLDGTIEIPKIAARDVVAVFGRTDVSAGTIAGTIALGGTIGTPTAKLDLDAHDITIPASVSGRAPAKLDDLAITGQWGGASGELDVTGNEAGGGVLHISVRGRPDQLSTLVASLEAAKFDIAPFAAFAPGVGSAARGTLDASLTLKGFDPDTGDLRGMLDVHQARVPLSSLLGTLRDGDVAVTIANHEITAKLTGKLGKGDLHGTGKVVLVGSTPSKAELTLTLHQISLIRALQPIIDASITGKFTHGPSQWTGDVTVDQAHVTVPSTGGEKLLEASAPSDMVFVDAPPPKMALLQRPPPDRPWLIADVELKPTTVDVLQDEIQVRGGISGKVTVSVGEGSIGLDGAIDAQRGDIDLLGTRSQLDHGSVVFDGTLDPLLNIRVIRDLTDFTITADIGGRLSKPDIQLSSDSGSYTQGDLVGFFLGGEPSTNQSDVGAAAAAAGAGLASSLVSKKIINKLLPVKLDINYETATSTSSEAIRVGRWINRHLFVAGRSHIEARPDENANEAVGEYHFANDMLIQGNIGDRGYAGLDLVHRWHW